MSTIPRIKLAGPSGVSAPGAASSPRKVYLASFMLEDYLEVIEAKLALADPENAERISWEQLKGKLGL
jgi:hypothetical protein